MRVRMQMQSYAAQLADGRNQTLPDTSCASRLTHSNQAFARELRSDQLHGCNYISDVGRGMRTDEVGFHMATSVTGFKIHQMQQNPGLLSQAQVAGCAHVPGTSIRPGSSELHTVTGQLAYPASFGLGMEACPRAQTYEHSHIHSIDLRLGWTGSNAAQISSTRAEVVNRQMEQPQHRPESNFSSSYVPCRGGRPHGYAISPQSTGGEDEDRAVSVPANSWGAGGRRLVAAHQALTPSLGEAFEPQMVQSPAEVSECDARSEQSRACRDETAQGRPWSNGSFGHPDFCSRPCVHMQRGFCQKGSACSYCHLPHAWFRNNAKPNRIQRHRLLQMTDLGPKFGVALLFRTEQRVS